MRRIVRLSLFFFRPHLFSSPKPLSLFFSPIYYYSSSSSDTNTTIKLTQEELNQINLLIPRLCLSNHLPEAIRLVHTALLTNPPPNSLSLSILIHSLSTDPDLTRTMSLLTRLKHMPSLSPPTILHIAKLFLSSYFKKGQPGKAIKVFNWVNRLDCPCEPDSGFFAIAVYGFCRNGMLLECLKAVRLMVGAGFMPAPNLRVRVYRGLLREAMTKEAQAFSEALGCIGSGEEGDQKVKALLDNMIANWAT